MEDQDPLPLIAASGLTAGYGSRPVLNGLDLELPRGGVTTILGPNGCGKSTLLRALAQLLPAQEGTILLAGRDVAQASRHELAQLLAILPQQPVAPEGVVVADLVAMGRHPHQSWLSQWSSTDERAVEKALQQTGVAEFADRALDELSGGQRQRVWIAMVLAQQTQVIFFDEPTTYLDLAHSIELLELIRGLADSEGRSVVMVLHDLNLAVRYSDRLVVLSKGEVRAVGAPEDVVTRELLAEVFGLDAVVTEDPVTGGPLVVPGAPQRPTSL
ncbi:hypothetical protein CATYP_02085 [Corynebacterium atypicum]|uniref:ABC transporter domain-containing protein n=1 Tax=Corynebacterium atypicum TaxID=191610 RepID=A0ABM5QLI4_9CORY|nr:hypothetical protein CATYP_02085 [Corynebacterium atypicum]